MTSTGPNKPGPSEVTAGTSSSTNTNTTLERDRELVMEKNKEWQRELLMARIRSRSSQQRSFNELARAGRMNMLDTRQSLNSVERGNLLHALDQMQNCVRTNTRQGLIERLESLSRQLGLTFMEEGDSLYISSDMFYLDITVTRDGTLVAVKVHHECILKLVECQELYDSLNARDFADFTAQLEGLTQIYKLNAEPKIKTKAFVALQAMEKDVETLFNAQQLKSSDVLEMLAESKLGLVFKRRGGHAMKLSYFISPYDLLDLEEKEAPALTLDVLSKQAIGNFATLNLEASSANKLQIAPIVSVNAEASNALVYAKLNANNSMMLPATFVLRLNKPLPVCSVALRALGLNTTGLALEMAGENNGNSMEACDTESNGSFSLSLSDFEDTPLDDIPANSENVDGAVSASTSAGAGGSGNVSEEKNVLSVGNLMNMIVLEASEKKMRNNDRGMFVTLPDQTHCYFFSDTGRMQGALLKSVPFTDPSQVPAIIEFLKKQSLFYTLLSSCVRPNAKVSCDIENTAIVEVGAKNFKQININLQNPYTERMVDVELELNGGNVTAHMYTYLETFEALSVKLSKIVQSCMSIPVTVRALLKYWEKEHMKQFQCNTGEREA